MRRLFLSLEGFIRAEPSPAVAAVREAFDQAGGWLLDAQAFSNVALSFTFEVTAARVPRLADLLRAAGVTLYDASEHAVAAWTADSSDGREVLGKLMLTLVHDRPDEPGVVPSVPG